MSKRTLILASLALAFVAMLLLLRFTAFGTSLVWDLSQGGKILLPLVITSALLDSLGPCSFAVLFLTIAFLLSVGKSRPLILTIGGFYIAGIFLAYLLIGLGILQALHIFNVPHFMAKVGAGLLILLGAINLLNVLFSTLPIRLRLPQISHGRMADLMSRVSIPAAFLLGGLVGLCEFPCTGGPYLMILGLLHDKVTYSSGVGYLLLYNLIFVLPLIIVLLLAANEQSLARLRSWQQERKTATRLWFGVITILLGVMILLL